MPSELNVNLLMVPRNRDKWMVNNANYIDPLPASALSAMTTVLEQPTTNKPPSPIF